MGIGRDVAELIKARLALGAVNTLERVQVARVQLKAQAEEARQRAAERVKASEHVASDPFPLQTETDE